MPIGKLWPPGRVSRDARRSARGGRLASDIPLSGLPQHRRSPKWNVGASARTQAPSMQSICHQATRKPTAPTLEANTSCCVTTRRGLGRRSRALSGAAPTQTEPVRTQVYSDERPEMDWRGFSFRRLPPRIRLQSRDIARRAGRVLRRPST